MALRSHERGSVPGPHETALHVERPAFDEQLHERFFTLFAGPIAWFVQLCLGYMLASEPCFPGYERRLSLPAHLAWTRGAIAVLMILAGIVAVLGLIRSWQAHRRSQQALQGDPHAVLRVGADRACFLALWGVLFNAGFAFASVMTFIAYFVLPRCDG